MTIQDNTLSINNKNQVNNDSEKQQNSQKQSKIYEQKYHSPMKIYLKCVIICMGSVYMGYNIGVLNLAYPKLEHEYGIEDNKELYKGLLSSCLLFGATVGCFVAGQIIQKVGERNCAIICDIIAIILACFYMIPEYFIAMAIRFLMGIILGINISTVSPFIKNISPLQILGKTGSFQSLFISTGVLIAVSIGQGYPMDQQVTENQNQIFWRFTLMFPIITCSLRLFSFTFIYKLNTPIYYLQNLKDEINCKKSLSLVYKPQYIEEQFDIIKQQLQIQQKTKDSFKSVFQKQARIRIILALASQNIFHLSGIMAVLMYSNTIFLKTTGDKQTSKIMNIGAAIFQVIPAFLSGELTKITGRRQILLWGYASLALILSSLGIVTLLNKDQLEAENVSQFPAILTIALIFIYCFIFRLTSGTVTWTYVSEIVSTKGNSLATSMHFFTAFLVGLLFPICVEQFGIHTMFFFFGFALVLGLFYLYPRLYETKGLLQKDIIEMFNNKQNKKQEKINFYKKNSQQETIPQSTNNIIQIDEQISNTNNNNKEEN